MKSSQKRNTAFSFEFEDNFHPTPVQDWIVFSGTPTKKMNEFFKKNQKIKNDGLIKLLNLEVDPDEYNNYCDPSDVDFFIQQAQVGEVHSTNQPVNDLYKRSINDFYKQLKSLLEKQD
jgi:hypothetical protein